MRLFLLKLALLAIPLAFHVSATMPEKAMATETVSIAVYYMPGLLEKRSDDAPYSQLLQNITQQISPPSEILFFHALRAADQFNKQNTDCLFPGSLNLYPKEAKVIESQPIYNAKAYFFAKQLLQTENIIDPEAEQLRIGYRRGNTFGGKIDELSHHLLIPLQSGSEIGEMIALQRIDVFLEYIPDAFAYIYSDPDSPLKYSELSPFYSQNDSLLCHDRPELRRFIEDFDTQLAQLEASGVLSTIINSMKSIMLKRTVPVQQ